MNTSGIFLRRLDGEASDMADLQRVLEQAPDYAHRVTGAPPGAADAQSTYTVLPPGKSYDDKFVLGIFQGRQMIGCVDLIRGYPDPEVALIGLLLIAEPFQRQGIGAAAHALLEAQVRAWRCCTRLRIGVLGTNLGVWPFWERLGYVPTGERKPFARGTVVSEIIVLSRPLDLPV